MFDPRTRTRLACETADGDPKTTRDLAYLVDQTIATMSTCRVCGSDVTLKVSPEGQPYQSWLVCTNPKCQHQEKLS